MSNGTQRIDTFANRLNAAMNARNMKQADLVERTNLSKQQVSQYVNGKFEAKQQAVYTLAQVLDVSEAWLMGYDVPMEKVQVTADTINEWEEKYNPNGRLAKETQLCELLEECRGADAMDAVDLYAQLDANDRAEIRGEMKHMLKSDKYFSKTESKNA